MDWFTRLTGFRETSYSETQARLEVDGSTLRITVNGKSYGIGQFERLCHLNVLAPSDRRASADSPETRASAWFAAHHKNFINTIR